ncbi:hypothetical protein [Curtobacterium herbarum]|uniref:Uncharacterized protein n=1 Tax=Curtobacterium herbarum TaxID=150122 RepID=A0ABN1Z9E3_9MICO|nr:hypothetical protein [Curtobacterium herbarum]MBM7476151.1 putative outer membrane lipoprotein [Curtobacterium herbarum]MCS6544281.1 hypothetical protein [Curtobacterium herbarum]
MHIPDGQYRPRPVQLVVATALLASATGVLLVLWLVMWLPVLLSGAATSLFAWPLVLVLAVAPWCAVIAALVLGLVARSEQPTASADAVIGISVILVLVVPAALWFGVPALLVT